MDRGKTVDFSGLPQSAHPGHCAAPLQPRQRRKQAPEKTLTHAANSWSHGSELRRGGAAHSMDQLEQSMDRFWLPMDGLELRMDRLELSMDGFEFSMDRLEFSMDGF
jgi:hypothetical protein